MEACIAGLGNDGVKIENNIPYKLHFGNVLFVLNKIINILSTVQSDPIENCKFMVHTN